MRMSRLLSTVGLLITATLPLSAQAGSRPRTPAPGGTPEGAAPATGPLRHPGPAGMGEMGDMHAGGMGGMMMRRPGGSPAAMLAHMKAQLNLTDDQVKRLETLAAQQKGALEPNVGAMLRARADLADARKGEGDLVATRKALEKLATLRVDGAMAHLKAMQDARAILTAEQREHLPAMMGGMMGGPTGGMNRGGMHGRGMMGRPGGMGMHGPGQSGGPGGHEMRYRSHDDDNDDEMDADDALDLDFAFELEPAGR